MKLNVLETHDRYKEFVRKDSAMAQTIGKCVQDIVNKRPFGNNPFYVFSHARTDDDGYTKRLIHQPRLTKPRAQTNSMLFRAYPGTDKIKIIWMIPARELWGQYKKENVTAADKVAWSIHMFENNRTFLELPEEDDLSEAEIDAIYRGMSQSAHVQKMKSSVKTRTTSLFLED